MSPAGPVHAHDCTACTFLGSADGRDLYACVRPVTGDRAFDGSLVARDSGEPSDYRSAPLYFSGVHDPYRYEPTGPLGEALGRAVTAGLVPHLLPAPRACLGGAPSDGDCDKRVVGPDEDFCPRCLARQTEPGHQERVLARLRSLLAD